jgi:hypothetical protein
MDLMVLATVGEAVGTEFNAFKRMAEKNPSFEQVTTDPAGTRIPSETDGMYAMTAMLCRRVSAQTVGAAVVYVRRMPLEYQTMWLSDVCRVQPQLVLASGELMKLQAELKTAMG